MKTYGDVFSQLKRDGRAGLIPFFVIGDPDFDTSLRVVREAVDAGADILELGIPFSDPIADGPTIQKADIRSLNSGMSAARALEFIQKIKAHKDIPIGLLMYYNLICQYGVEQFCRDFRGAGVNSVLVADLSIDDADEICTPASSAGLDTVFMVTPNTAEQRIAQIVSRTTGFVYTVSLLGVTGSRDQLSTSIDGLVGTLKGRTNVPVCVGFGISKPEHAVAVARAGADGVIIGSALVRMIENNLGNPEKMLTDISAFIKNVRAALATVGTA